MFTWRNPLGYLGFFAVLGAVGLVRDIDGYLGFFGFAYYFRYFWVLPDEMLLDYVRRSAAWAFFTGTGATLVTTLVSVFAAEPRQAFGFGMYSLYISVARQLVVLVPAAYLLSLSGVLGNVWWSFPIAELISLSGGLLMLRHVLKKTGMAIPKK